jgi:signal transduction histidine kinase
MGKLREQFASLEPGAVWTVEMVEEGDDKAAFDLSDTSRVAEVWEHHVQQAIFSQAMQRLLSNLIENALRHGEGPVEVTTAREGHMNILEVLDRGPGIPAEDAARMLQPFTRLNSARSTSGTGLGLAIVDRIARLHGGAVHLLSRDGGGLRVRIEMPGV